MTPIFVTDLAFALPGPLPFEGNIPYEDQADLGYATIALGSNRQVQGPVLRRRGDGTVTIDAGGRMITGKPVNAALAAPSRGFWARLSGRAS